MRTLTLDRKKPKNPTQARRAERLYGRQLKRLAEQVGLIINGFPPGDPTTLPTIEDMLRRYAESLLPWAERTAAAMIAEVNQRDEATWRAIGNELSAELRREISLAPTGQTMRRLLAEQVELIRSIPIDAGKRVHELTLKGLEDSTRAKEIAAEIRRSGEVAESRAMLIARTEVARTASTLTEARAKAIGAEQYIWRTSGDGDVREDHRILNGKVFSWNDPPIADQRSGARANPGCIYNCRCYAEPIIPV